MNWPGFFALSNAALFALIGPLVLVYFLKLKRPRLDVPSLVLWTQVLQDHRVNSPFQKFKRNLLLLLQLLLLILLVLAAMQPYWRGSAERAQRLPVLIDCSASMAAINEETGVSQLDEAKNRVREMIDGLLPDQQLCLITFGRTAQRLTGFTDNTRILLDALDKVQVRDVSGDVEDALRMTQALSMREPFEKVLLLTDGNLPEQANVELACELEYQQLPRAGPNLGITTLNAKRAGALAWDVFVRIDATPQAGGSATVELLEGDQVLDEVDVVLGAGESERLVFPVNTDRTMSLRVRLLPDGFDALASDNAAWLNLSPPRPLLAYAPKKMVPYRLALNAIEYLRVFPDDNQTEQSSYDLIMTDQPADQNIEAGVCFYVGVVPDDIKQLIAVERGKDATTVIDWRRDAPVLQHVELTDLIVLDNPRSRDDVRDEHYEAAGYEIMAHGRYGPLLLRKRVGPRSLYYLLFDTDRSDLPWRVGFPIMVSNLVKMAMHQSGLAEVSAHRTGVLPPIPVDARGNLTVQGPSGLVTDEAQADENGLVTGIPVLRAGQYQIKDGGATIAEVGASLLSSSETSLEAVERIQFRELSVSRAGAVTKTDQSFWRALAIAALIMLVIEWWYYQRKPGGFRT